MEENFNPKLRDGLRKIIKKSGYKVSSGSIIREFCKTSISANVLRQFHEVVRPDPIALNLFEVNEETSATNLEKIEPIKWLEKFLEKYLTEVLMRKARIRSQQMQNDDFGELKRETVAQIVEKVVKAANDGLQKASNKHLKKLLAKYPLETDRPHSLWYFSRKTMKNLPRAHHVANCAALPVTNQEQLLVDDLLYILTGTPGDYITPIINEDAENGFGPITFQINEQMDVSLQNVVNDILPLASHYSILQKFTQWSSQIDNEIIQALSETLQNILNDYTVSIVQLENESIQKKLTLHKLLYLIRPNMQTMEILVEIINKIIQSDMAAGMVLSLLYDEITLQTGNKKSQKILIELTEKASVPYIEMLELWILKGVIIDEYNQFFVVDHGNEMMCSQVLHQPDTVRYWESRYTIHQDRVPRFLENDADIILRTGKYLNVIRQCGKQISPPPGLKKLEFSPTNNAHSTSIKNAYHNASKILLELLVKENNLMAHISSVKKYFLLQQGDLITHFMDASEEELSKNVDKVAPVRLDNLLQLIVRLSSAKHDPCIEHLHCDIFAMDLAKQMSKIHIAGIHYDDIALSVCEESTTNIDLTGLECFVFKYEAQWPVSIVLNQWALSQYQMLFRLLFYCKHVERQLCKVWIENTGISKSTPNIRKLWRCAFSLRQRMLNAIQHVEYYMMVEVIEPNWNIFTEKMKTVQNIDEVITIHQDFLHNMLFNCMLNYPELLRALLNICNVCLQFSKFIQTETIDDAVDVIDSYGKEFTENLLKFLKLLDEISAENRLTAKFVNLVCRLNFNSFYKN